MGLFPGGGGGGGGGGKGPRAYIIKCPIRAIEM